MKILLFRAQLVDILNNLKEKPDVATLLLVIPLVIFWNHVFFFKHAGELCIISLKILESWITNGYVYVPFTLQCCANDIYPSFYFVL